MPKLKVYYSRQYSAAAEQFDTMAKSRWIAQSLTTNPISGVQIVAPRALSADEIEIAHDREYIEALQTGAPVELAESQGLDWDPGLWTSVTTSTGGVVAAAKSAMRDGVAGSLSSGLHHARRDSGSGFCSINGLAIAAKTALRTGASSVAILDVDAHAGGGTASIIDGDAAIMQADVSVSAFDSYTDTENSTHWLIDRPADYLDAVEEALRRLINAPNRPELLLYNSGMDVYWGCDIGGLLGITRSIIAERERLVFESCARASVPVCFVLAGGYVGEDLPADVLVNLHRETIITAARVS